MLTSEQCDGHRADQEAEAEGDVCEAEALLAKAPYLDPDDGEGLRKKVEVRRRRGARARRDVDAPGRSRICSLENR